MQTLSIDDFKKMIARAFSEISARADEFSALDAITGDGDHGQAMVTAFMVINETTAEGSLFKPTLNDIGFNVMLSTSGSTSTLLGAFLLGMGDAVGDAAELGIDGIKAMFNGGLENVRKNTKAAVGDKTMMDALIPAVETISSSQSPDLREIFDAAAKAAAEGAAATKEMKANFGRARNYGERSKGSPDAGASSWSCMFSAFAQALRE